MEIKHVAGIRLAARGPSEQQGHLPIGLSMLREIVIDHKRMRSEEHTSELQSQSNLVCRLLLEKKKPHDIYDRTGARQMSRHGLCARHGHSERSTAHFHDGCCHRRGPLVRNTGVYDTPSPAASE